MGRNEKFSAISDKFIESSSPLISQLCLEIFENNVLTKKHNEIIEKSDFLKHFSEDLTINLYNVSRYGDKNFKKIKEESIHYWIYLIVRDFEKKVHFF